MIFIFSSSVVLSSLSITSSETKMNNNFKNLILQAPRIELGYLNFSNQKYVMGTYKNRLNETVLLSTQDKCLNCRLRISHFLYSYFYISTLIMVCWG